MNFKKLLQRRLSTFPNIRPGQLKQDVVKVDEIQRCAEIINPDCLGAPDQLMFPSLFRNKRRRRK